MVKKTTVIFMLFITLLTASLCTSCGSRQPGSDSGSAVSESGGDGSAHGTVAGESGNGSAHGTAAGESESKTGEEAEPSDAKHSDASIPDTEESAVGDWGTEPGKTAGSDGAVAKGSGSSDSGSKESGSSDSGSKGSGSSGTPDYSEVLVDRDDLFFAIKEVRSDTTLGYTWKVYIENRTDKNLMFSFEKVSVNGIMCDPFWAEVITGGRKGNCDITWMRDAFDSRSIGDVYEVNFTLNVYNDDDYTEAPLMRDPFTVFPMGEEKAVEAAKADAEARTGAIVGLNKVLIDNDTCSVIVTGYEPDNVWGYAMHVYLQNKSGDDLVFSAENTSINGIMCEPYWAEVVASGKSAISTILWDKSSLDENAITQVREISLPLKVYSDKNIAEPYVDETIELEP